MPTKKPDSYYIGIARRFLGGEEIGEIADDLGKAKTTIRSNVKKGVRELLRPFYDGRMLHLPGLEDLVGDALHVTLTQIRDNLHPLQQLVQGKLDHQIPQQYRYRTFTGYAYDHKTQQLLDYFGKYGWEVVATNRIGKKDAFRRRGEKVEVEFVLRLPVKGSIDPEDIGYKPSLY